MEFPEKGTTARSLGLHKVVKTSDDVPHGGKRLCGLFPFPVLKVYDFASAHTFQPYRYQSHLEKKNKRNVYNLRQDNAITVKPVVDLHFITPDTHSLGLTI